MMLLAKMLRKDSRAATALMFALALPVILAAVGLGINVGYWADVSIGLQRTADMAALAGGETYYTGSAAQLAAEQAANVAELNGESGGATRSWNTTTQVLTDGNITVQVMSGVRYAGDVAFRVTVRQSVPVFLSGFLRTASSENLGATALAEVITGYPSCMISLAGAVNGATTATGTTLSGHTDVAVTNCAIRSDSAANISGDVTVTGEAIYAGGSIGINGGGGHSLGCAYARCGSDTGPACEQRGTPDGSRDGEIGQRSIGQHFGRERNPGTRQLQRSIGPGKCGRDPRARDLLHQRVRGAKPRA